MSYYTEKNGLAEFWNRDNTRIEWAKWVYHHPDETEQLIAKLLEETDLKRINKRIDMMQVADEDLQRQIIALEGKTASPLQLSNADIDAITGIDPDNPPEVPSIARIIYEALSDEDIDNITGVNLNG